MYRYNKKSKREFNIVKVLSDNELELQIAPLTQ